MPFHVIAHLVTHSSCQGELAAIFQLRVQLAFKAQQHMPAPAPVIRQVAGRVLKRVWREHYAAAGPGGINLPSDCAVAHGFSVDVMNIGAVELRRGCEGGGIANIFVA